MTAPTRREALARTASKDREVIARAVDSTARTYRQLLYFGGIVFFIAVMAASGTIMRSGRFGFDREHLYLLLVVALVFGREWLLRRRCIDPLPRENLRLRHGLDGLRANADAPKRERE